jgi:hypothetical protein
MRPQSNRGIAPARVTGPRTLGSLAAVVAGPDRHRRLGGGASYPGRQLARAGRHEQDALPRFACGANNRGSRYPEIKVTRGWESLCQPGGQNR